MKKISLTVIIIVIIAAISFSYTNRKKKKSIDKNSVEINKDDFKRYIKSKPYSILYFWVSWCGYSQAGLVNDYYKNYDSLNNDTVQSQLIVVSDTSSINSFMQINNINLPYKCLYTGKYSIITRNIKDGENMEKFIYDMFQYKDDFAFPTILLVDSAFNVILWGTETKHAVSNYRFIEEKKRRN